LSRAFSKIGKITTSGTYTTYSLPSPPVLHSPYGITTGPDNNLWFTDSDIVARPWTLAGVMLSVVLPPRLIEVKRPLPELSQEKTAI
jgi:hypothetical protein